MITKALYFLLALTVTASHPLHVAVCEISLNKKNSTLEFTHKIFTDDLEKAIERSTGTKLLLGNPSQAKDSKQLIGNYVVQHFLFKNNGKIVRPGYLGYEQENDQLFIYFEAKIKGKPEKVDITYNPLMEVYEDQASIIHMNFSGVKKTMYLNVSKPRDYTEF